MSKLSENQHKILFIDDNEKILTLMKEIFSSKNYKIITKQSGAEGLAYIKENELISVVISDFKMKGMNGLEFLQQVKALSPITKRCLCSGSFDKKTLDKKVQDKEIDAFMMKPVNFAKMLTTIDTFVENLGEKIVLLPLAQPTETGDYIQGYKNKKEKVRG
jgi:response regulator RpfG family c-di-GMP phosphodiesterase